LDRLVVDGDTYDSPHEMANKFATIFDLNYANDKVPEETVIPQNARNTNNKLESVRITPHIVKSILKSRRLNAAAESDGIPPRIIQNCAENLSFSLSALFNYSLSTGKIPRDWKTANVIPIHKTGNKSDPCNYKPISITSSVCKVLEEINSGTVLEFLYFTN
jgi:hypothetical protein